MADTNITPEAKAKEDPVPKAVAAIELVAAPVSAAAGLYAAQNNVKNEAYVALRRAHNEQGMNLIHATEKKLGISHRNDNALFAAGMNALKADGNPYGEAAHDLGKIHSNNITKVFRALKLNGVSDYWKTLSKVKKVETAVIGATVTSLVLGATLIVTQNKQFQSLFRHNGKDDGQAR